MVNTVSSGDPVPRAGVTVIGAYLALTLATLAALLVLTVARPALAPAEAWGHAVVVTVLAGVLWLRLRSARAGSRSALRALPIIAIVLPVVNLVEAALPDVFPGWMRVEMVAVAVLMAGLVFLLVRARRAVA